MAIHLRKGNVEALFYPDKGMNMASLKKNGVEIIDQSTQALFEERFAGLGALIGPHFHHRKSEVLPKIADESLFPHIARVRAKGIDEPFSHGIARYAPWKAEATNEKVKAVINGKDEWRGVPLETLEGQNFKMSMTAELTDLGINVDLSVVSDTDSLVGIHYYYRLPPGTNRVKSRVQPEYLSQEGKKSISWDFDNQNRMTFNLNQFADYTFHPYPNKLEGRILLDTQEYQLVTLYRCASQENSWQLYHPEGASYACIEPISAQDPRHPNLSVSSIQIQLQIFNPGSVHE